MNIYHITDNNIRHKRVHIFKLARVKCVKSIHEIECSTSLKTTERCKFANV